MMILDLDRKRSRYPIDSSEFPPGCVANSANRAEFRIDRRLIASPSRRHRPCSPLSRTDTARRSRPAREAASLADSLQIGGFPGRVRLDGEAPVLGAVTVTSTRHFKINTFRALSRSLLGNLTRGRCPSRDTAWRVDDTCGNRHCHGGASAG